jgi:diacylglycerol kinase (ATP)
MASPFGPMVLIVNPASGRGKVGAQLEEVRAALRSLDLEHRVALTAGTGDATRAAREALESGTERFVVAVGGDGTVNEVVNGMVADDQPIRKDAVLGVIAAGSGCDFVRTFGLPGDSVEATRHLAGENTMPLDLGKVTYLDKGDAQAVRYFANIAEVGLGASTVRRADGLPRWFGRSRYLLGFWMTLPGFKKRSSTVVAGAMKRYEGEIHQVVVANCQFYGGGMKISPRSWPSDGALDTLVFHGPKSDSFTILPKVFRGEHLPHKNIVEFRSRSVTVETQRPMDVEADGELLGTTPASFGVLWQALTLKV